MTLPVGFAVRLNHRVRVMDGGRVLVGGAPTRVVTLASPARDLLEDRRMTVTDPTTAALADRLLELGMADPIVAELAPFDAEVTFVVPVRDRPAMLRRLLRSIGEGARIIVVDDASRDAAAVRRVAEGFRARLVVLSRNLGPAGARNAGLAVVETPYVVFVDSDMVLDPDTVPVLLRHFADPRVALVSPRILGLAGERSNWIGRYEDARSSLDLGRHPSMVRPRSPVSWIPAAFLVARVDALEGGFSGELRVAEDVDLVWRLAERGWRVRYEPAVRARHEHRVTVGDWLSRKAYYGTGADLLAQRHGYDVAPAVLAPWSAGVVIAALAQRRWSLPVILLLSAITVVRMTRKLSRIEHPVRVSVWLTGSGVLAALGQTMALLLRHWWPLAAALAPFSRRLRRAIAVAAVVDSVIEYRRTDAKLDPLRFGIARRLDDLAYGAGVWFGALKGRSVRALLPDIRAKREG